MMSVEESVDLTRDVIAVKVPSGDKVVVKGGTTADIVQSLGGSFTVMVHGMMMRIDGDNADALGREPPERPQLAEGAGNDEVSAMIWDQLRSCYDPEIPINIVDLGLVYNCKLDEFEPNKRRVDIEMTLTAPGCGMGQILAEDVRFKAMTVPTVEEAQVELVFDPPWNPGMMTEEARLRTGMF